MEPLYRIEELTTTGWGDQNEKQSDMNKEQCQKLYQQLLNGGTNPDNLRIKRVS